MRPKSPNETTTKRKYLSSVPDEEIYSLRKKELSYEKIANHYHEQGIKVSVCFIRRRCKEIFNKKGEDEPKIKRQGQKENKIKDIKNEEIFKLREEEMSYRDIVKYFANLGIKISVEAVRRRYKKFCFENGKKKRITRVRRKRENIPDEEIFELREKGMSYVRIAKYYKDKGINVSAELIRNRCKNIYQRNDKQEPKAKYIKRIEDIPEELIYELSEQGMSYREIKQYLANLGIIVSIQTIKRRCDDIYLKKGKKTLKKQGRKKIKNIPDEKIYELREQGLSYKQISDYFFEKGIEVSYGLIRVRCKNIYKAKGLEEPPTNCKFPKRGEKTEYIEDIQEESVARDPIVDPNRDQETLEQLDQELNRKLEEKIKWEGKLAMLLKKLLAQKIQEGNEKD